MIFSTFVIYNLKQNCEIEGKLYIFFVYNKDLVSQIYIFVLRPPEPA